MPKERTRVNYLNYKLRKHLNETYHLFNCKIKRFVIEESKSSHAYHCSVCNQTIIGDAANVDQHMYSNIHVEKFHNLKDSIIMPQILKFHESHEPILGLEYLVELADTPYGQEVHVCCLCRVKEKNIIDHFVTDEHSEKYLKTHFPVTLTTVNKYLKNHPDVKHEFFRLIRVIISSLSQDFALMLPTVCFYDEFYCGLKTACRYVESKAHLEESTTIFNRVIYDLGDVIKDLQTPRVETDNVDDDDIVMIKTEIPKIDLTEEDDEQKLDHSERKLEDPKPSVSIASSVNSNSIPSTAVVKVEPLSNEELELLMANFVNLKSEQQIKLTKMLSYIKNTDPKRYKILKSPF